VNSLWWRYGVLQTVALVGLGFATSLAGAEDWPHWRGPNRDGTVPESSYWKDGGWPPKATWSAGVGLGSSSPLVVDGRLYSLGHSNGRDEIACRNAETGKVLWSFAYACPKYGRNSTGDKGIYSGPSSTPEYDAETAYLYTLSIDGDLHCLDTARQGEAVWSLNLYDRYRAEQRPRVGRSGRRDYGYTTSPLVLGERLIVEVGAKSGNLVALDKRSGRQLWASENKDPAGHTGGPVPLTVEGAACVAVLTHFHLLAARVDAGNEGKTVAEHDWETSFANNIASPAVEDNHVLITSGYNQNAICKLEITLAGAKRLWQQPYASKVCSPVIFEDRIYFAWRRLRCLDLATGRQLWEGGSFGDPGSCIATNDARLIVWGGRGRLALIETARRSPDEYRELATLGPIFRTDAWPHVVLADGCLYVKDRNGNLKCFALQGR